MAQKRRRSTVVAEDGRAAKKVVKCLETNGDFLSALSDEILLRIFSFLAVDSVAVCAQVSRRFNTVTNDYQIWRPAFLDRWMRTRLQRANKAIDWKKRYKTCDNWTKGRCSFSEVPMDAPATSLLAQLHSGVVITADERHGLRAWSCRSERHLVAQFRLEGASKGGRDLAPTAMEAGISRMLKEPTSKATTIAIGASDGSLGLYSFDRDSASFACLWRGEASDQGPIMAIAISGHHILTLVKSQALSLYRFDQAGTSPPIILCTIQGQPRSGHDNCSLSLCSSESESIIRIAYSLPCLSSGWAVGIQEFTISVDGAVLSSRSAMSNNMAHFKRPTALTYKHPYIVSCHSDNTLTLYNVASDLENLSIGPGHRLWGHTSAVLGAHVGEYGMAISVSRRGDEVRVWSLADASSSGTSGDLQLTGVQLQPKQRHPTVEVMFSLAQIVNELRSRRRESQADDLVTNTWASFDDDHAVVLREHENTRQAMAVYDFTT